MDILPYKIRLENYCGPLDLLLHLVREDEVEILNIPVARVTEQYIAYIGQMQKMDIDLAGEFLVMAATLMEIKSRTLVPPEADIAEDEPDPRLELIRKLLEYRRFKSLARGLSQMEEAQSKRFGRPAFRPSTPPPADEGPLLVVDVFDLVRVYAKLARETGFDVTAQILYDDVPIELLMEEIAKRITLQGKLRFSEMIPDRKNLVRVVSTFLAVLELTRLQRIAVTQDVDFGDMDIEPAAANADGPNLDIPGSAVALRVMAARASHAAELHPAEPSPTPVDPPATPTEPSPS